MSAGVVSGAGADGSAQGLACGAEPGPGLPRRRLLLAGAGLVSTAGLGAVVWQASRPDAARPRVTPLREPPARRAAIWRARITVPRPQLMAAANGVVCVAGDEGAYFNPGTARDMVQALDARDGSHMWTFTVRTGRPGMSFADPPGLAAGPGYVYVAVDRLYCLRAGDGATVWSVPFPVTTALTAAPDAVYAVQETLFALRSRDGTRLWSYAANAGANPAPILVNGVIYLLAPDPQGDPLVLAIRASDGTRLWDSPGPRVGWLACDGTTVCAVSGLGPDVQISGNGEVPPSQMWTWRAGDGRLLSRSAADAGFSSPPAMTAGIACAFTIGRLTAVDPGNGRTLWSYPATASSSSPPAAADARIYTSTITGDLVALNATDGTPAWHFPTRVTLGPLLADNTVYVCDRTTVYAVPA